MVRVRRPFVLMLLLVCLALAACGDDDDGGSGAATTAAAQEQAGAFPRDIQQKLGTVTIPEQPERVVTLDFPSTDAALALGITPVGIWEVSYVDGGIQPWTKAALKGARPAMIDTTDGFPFEKIAALDPDVILATNTFPLISESWDRLNAIAPVVGHIDEPGADPWADNVRMIGDALGREDQAETAIAAAEEQVTQAREANPAFDGSTVSIFNYVAGDGLYVIQGQTDASIRFFKDLGFSGAPEAVDALKGETGRAQVSAERYDVLDADVLVGTSPDPQALDELGDERVFRQVPAVGRGAWVPITIDRATAMAFPSALSVPYAVDELLPQLTAAMDGS